MREVVPPAWPHAVRSDHFVFHRREHRGDWTRLVVSLSNCLVTAITAWLLVVWVRALGFAGRTALWTGLAYALATSAWAYSRTFLSEPLSGLGLVAAAYCVTRGGRWLWLAGAVAGFSLHVHVLNLVFVPCLFGYALLRGARRGGAGGLVALAIGGGLLLLGQQLRFGDPLETGRFGHYSEFVAPWEGLLAQAIAPGRSFFLYSPAVLLGLWGWAALRRRLPAVFWFAVAAIALRWLVISTRSDWFGGWGLGPRHLVPVIPVAMLGFAAALERLPDWRAWPRRAWWCGLGLGVHIEPWSDGAAAQPTDDLANFAAWFRGLQQRKFLAVTRMFQVFLISHNAEFINHLARDHGLWFSRERGGPTRVRRYAETMEGPLSPSEQVAQGVDP